MALSIKDQETDRLVRRYADRKGLSYTRAIRLAVGEALARDDATPSGSFADRVRRIQDRVARHPRNELSAEDAMGYDEHGLPR